MVFLHGPTLMVQLPWANILKNQFEKPFGPSLGLNQKMNVCVHGFFLIF